MDLRNEKQKLSSEKIRTSYHTMWIENGILVQIYQPGLDRVTLDIAKKIVADRLQLCEGISYTCFTDSRHTTDLNDDARKYFGSAEAHQLVIAYALLVRNPFAKLIGNFFLLFDNIKVPAKLFSNKEKAFEWLKPYKFLN